MLATGKQRWIDGIPSIQKALDLVSGNTTIIVTTANTDYVVGKVLSALYTLGYLSFTPSYWVDIAIPILEMVKLRNKEVKGLP